jgi:acylphosphatase
MVERIFCIEGDNEEIVNVGLPANLMGRAGQYNIKLHTSNLDNEGQVRIIASGSSESIESFHEYVTANDMRFQSKGKPPYKVTALDEHAAFNIAFSNYHESFSNEQNGRTRFIAENKLESIDSKLDEINTTLKDISYYFRTAIKPRGARDRLKA